jgi:tetratricopeptide (TPR) repeat protein
VTIVRRVLGALVWSIVMVVVALGVAGLVTAANRPPGTAARPELTWAADSAVQPELDAATAELRAIASQVEALGTQGRGALAAMAARQFATLDEALTRGTALVREIQEQSAAVRGRLADDAGFGPGAELRLSGETRGRRERLLSAVEATDGLAVSWVRLTQGARSAATLSQLLARHDQLITLAIEAGRAGDFPTALNRIANAARRLELADEIREELGNTTDVDTLVEWLRRNRAYDEALRTVYEATAASPDRVTRAIREALAAEQEARDQLPEDTRGMVIIMSEIGRGGLNQAVIAIEQARGELDGALESIPDASR